MELIIEEDGNEGFEVDESVFNILAVRGHLTLLEPTKHMRINLVSEFLKNLELFSYGDSKVMEYNAINSINSVIDLGRRDLSKK